MPYALCLTPYEGRANRELFTVKNVKQNGFKPGAKLYPCIHVDKLVELRFKSV